jgi:hypothetical protein
MAGLLDTIVLWIVPNLVPFDVTLRQCTFTISLNLM